MLADDNFSWTSPLLEQLVEDEVAVLGQLGAYSVIIPRDSLHDDYFFQAGIVIQGPLGNINYSLAGNLDLLLPRRHVLIMIEV